MADFKPGDVVCVIDGPRAGEVTTVLSGPFPPRHEWWAAHPSVTAVYRLDLASLGWPGQRVAAPAAWLRPLPPSAEQSAAEVAEGLVERARRREFGRVRT